MEYISGKRYFEHWSKVDKSVLLVTCSNSYPLETKIGNKCGKNTGKIAFSKCNFEKISAFDCNNYRSQGIVKHLLAPINRNSIR